MYTKDRASVQWIVDWRDAALADGWASKPTYSTESIDRAIKMERDGFTVMILTRDPQSETDKRGQYEYGINVWGPDDLCIAPPRPYSFEALQVGLRVCSECGATDVETGRVEFARRVCKACQPAARAKYEKPGWCD